MKRNLGIIVGIAFIMMVSSSFASEDSVRENWNQWLGARSQGPTLKARWSQDQRRVQSVRGLVVSNDDSRAPAVRVSELATQVRSLQGMTGAELGSLRKTGTRSRQSYRYPQLYDGLSVEGHDLVINVRADGAIVGFENNLNPFVKPATPVKLTEDKARELAVRALDPGATPMGAKVAPTLVVLPVMGAPVRVWRVPVAALPHGFYTVYVRADDGQVLWVRNQMIR